MGSFMYINDNWNRFDMLLLLLNDIAAITQDSSSSVANYNLDSIPILLRALRLGKIVKYVKISFIIGSILRIPYIANRLNPFPPPFNR
jgi:hypothetical protein